MAIKSLPNVKYVMGSVSENADVSFVSKTASLSVQGVDTEVWKEITTEELSSGRFLTVSDSYAVVIGENVANSVFADNPISLNNKILIEGKSFNVVGILEGGRSLYIPLDVARNVLEDVGDKELDSISVKIIDVELADQTVEEIDKKLMLSRGILRDKDKDFSVSSPTAFQETITSTLNTISLFLAAIAAISLVVGAVGIANTMFTAVLEKTKEIGIMKAIGAKDIDIMLIFLFNSGLIGLVGGVGGIILGIFGSGFIGYLAGSETTGGGFTRMFGGAAITSELLLGALFFSIVIGMIAGAIPAYRASKLNPVDALRYE
jgi:putative ABC transport system permease protein